MLLRGYTLTMNKITRSVSKLLKLLKTYISSSHSRRYRQSKIHKIQSFLKARNRYQVKKLITQKSQYVNNKAERITLLSCYYC